MDVWTRFDAMLPHELSRVRARLNGLNSGREPPETNYELFYRVSAGFAGRQDLTMGELSARLSVPLSTATRIVDWLVDRGYASRVHDSLDRRVVRVVLTPAGCELHGNIEGYVHQRVKEILRCLAPEERTTLFNLIRKVVSSVKAGQ